jgi:hypothetical protein
MVLRLILVCKFMILGWYLSGQSQNNSNLTSIPPTGNWMIYFGNQSFAKNKWVWHNEVQWRNYNAAGKLEQLLLRTGLGYNLPSGIGIVSGGYAFIQTNPVAIEDGIQWSNPEFSFSEHRLWQQLILRNKIGRLIVLHRYRIEQRFFESDYRDRFRYFVSFNVPISRKEMLAKTWYLSFYNEIFIHGERRGDAGLFDRNRLYSAIGYQLNRSIRFEAGYMDQHVANAPASRGQFQFVCFNNLSF